MGSEVQASCNDSSYVTSRDRRFSSLPGTRLSLPVAVALLPATAASLRAIFRSLILNFEVYCVALSTHCTTTDDS